MSIELGELSNGVALTQVTMSQMRATNPTSTANCPTALLTRASLFMNKKIQTPRPIPPNTSPANLAHGKPKSSVAVWAAPA